MVLYIQSHVSIHPDINELLILLEIPVSQVSVTQFSSESGWLTEGIRSTQVVTF